MATWARYAFVWPTQFFSPGVPGECDFEASTAHDEDCPEVAPFAHGLAANDVFIVEGQQERYGSKDAWQAARR